MHHEKKKFVGVDYLSRPADRRRLSHYLKATNFKKIAGSTNIGYSIRRNRLRVLVLFIIILCTGLYFVLK